jgi:hypothetical protein
MEKESVVTKNGKKKPGKMAKAAARRMDPSSEEIWAAMAAVTAVPAAVANTNGACAARNPAPRTTIEIELIRLVSGSQYRNEGCGRPAGSSR